MTIAAAMSASSASYGSVAPMPALVFRSGTDGSTDGGGGSAAVPPALDNKSQPGRYLAITFSFDPAAGQLVMFYRNTTTGKVESQIPSEVVLKYETAARHQHPKSGQHAYGSTTANAVGQIGQIGQSVGAQTPSGTDAGKSITTQAESSAGSSTQDKSSTPSSGAGETSTVGGASETGSSSGEGSGAVAARFNLVV